MQKYLKSFYLKSILAFLLTSCQYNSLVQGQSSPEHTEKIENIDEKSVIVGAEQLEKISELVKDKKIGVVGNQTSLVGEVHLVDTLLALEMNVIKIFSPEHGFRGEADAGEHVASNIDEKTGLPIISIYGSNKKPSPEQLSDVDILLFDLQDVGVRFYTYISTLHYVMEAAAENHIKVVLLDRPNPNGHYVDGPIREKGFESFVGMHPIPVVHGMTIGEIAQMINGEKWLKNGVRCDLDVVSMMNYDRNKPYSLPVSPSPNLSSDESIQLYPGLCFFEGTEVSVGRGTTTPFEVFGHPDLKDKEGFTYAFTPVSSFGAKKPLQENQLCYGMNLKTYAQSKRIDKLEIKWLMKAYQAMGAKESFFSRTRFFDLLAGTDKLRKQIREGKSEEEIRASWEEGIKTFLEMRQAYLIYP